MQLYLTNNKITAVAEKLIYSPVALREVKKLNKLNEPKAKLLAVAIKKTLNFQFDETEKVWIEKIEAKRNELINSTEEIEIVDFGAGSKRDNGNNNGISSRVIHKKVGDVCRSASSTFFWSAFIFNLVRKLEPEICLELGTSLGISALYQSAAMKINGTGKLITIEGSPSLSEIAQKNATELELDNVSFERGSFVEKLPGVLKDLNKIDFVFIDGHHEGRATLNYFNEVMPNLNPGAVVIFDDIRWSSSMKSAWSEIRKNGDIRFYVDLWNKGLCVYK